MNELSVESPCIRRCTLDDDDICVGCYRHIDEVRDWSTSSPAAQREILARCQLRRQGRLQAPFVQEP